jgi:hypothetical protein
MVGLCLKFLSQAAYVHIHSARSHKSVATPNFVQQTVAAEDPARVRSQEMKEFEFERAESYAPFSNGYFLSVRVEAQITSLDDLELFQRARLPSQHRFHPGNEFARAERLYHIIISTQFEPQDAVDFLPLRGQKYYRHSSQAVIGAQALADFESIEVG